MPASSDFDLDATQIRLPLRGDLDLSTRDAVGEVVAAALRSCPSRIDLDLSAVTFIDCAGLCGILRARQLGAERNCHVVVADMSAAARRFLALTDTLALLTARCRSCDDRRH